MLEQTRKRPPFQRWAA